ncbi:MAG: M20 family metallopeptidase [Gammaproteobacteria bacterium]|nr:M20 family metallopeptidase [Gammaproteobacteria bacterium]
MQKPLESGQIYSRMVELRRSLHSHPELAFEEERTAGLIIEELERLGIQYEYSGKGGGVVGRLINGENDSPTVALRAEMDALPGAENTDLPFASSIAGKMHACGHDAHMAMVLGAAALLVASPPQGNTLFVFQPAEEQGGGARVVLASGALEGVRAIFGGHVTRHYRVGEIMVAAGTITAQSDRFTIKVQGKGGHGARPHEAIDAVVVTGLFITAVQTLVSREIDPVHPSVVTIGKVEAGTAANVIAEQATLEGSIRTTRPEVRSHIHQGLTRMARALAELHNAHIDIRIDEGYPPVVNTERETRIAYRAARNVVGESGLMMMDHPSMGSEDFAYYLHQLPGCYVRFGARSDEQYIPLHSPAFDIDEGVLKVGAVFFDELARQALQEYAN